MFNGNPDIRLATSTALSSAKVLSLPVGNSQTRTTFYQNFAAIVTIDLTVLSLLLVNQEG
ncbi:hypothetical protein HAX54_006109, partial [Datura stramonium]|nr:hypothetical protein [Datura stramonium]